MYQVNEGLKCVTLSAKCLHLKPFFLGGSGFIRISKSVLITKWLRIMVLAENTDFKKFGVIESFYMCHENQKLFKKLFVYSIVKLIHDKNHYKQDL